MKTSLFTTLLFIMICQTLVFSQSESINDIVVDGIIVNTEDGKPVPFVHVINITTKQGTASNLQGRFTVKMKPTDSIVFSAIGFDKFIFQLKEGVGVSRLDITIELNTNSLELEPVQIFAYKDVRALKQAIVDLNIETEPDKSRIQLAGFYYGPRKEVAPSSILNPLSYVYSKVSKRAKEERKYKKLEVEYDAWRKNVLEKYNAAVVQEVTGLEEDEVDEFMRFCKMDDRFIKLSTQYEVVVAINICLNDYREDTKVD